MADPNYTRITQHWDKPSECFLPQPDTPHGFDFIICDRSYIGEDGSSTCVFIYNEELHAVVEEACGPYDHQKVPFYALFQARKLLESQSLGKTLLNSLIEDIKAAEIRISALKKYGKVKHSDLVLLFQPGEIVFAVVGDGQGEQYQGFMCCGAHYDEDENFILSIYELQLCGTDILERQKTENVQPYPAWRDRNTFTFYPVAFHPKEVEIKKCLLQLGQKSIALKDHPYHCINGIIYGADEPGHVPSQIHGTLLVNTPELMSRKLIVMPYMAIRDKQRPVTDAEQMCYHFFTYGLHLESGLIVRVPVSSTTPILHEEAPTVPPNDVLACSALLTRDTDNISSSIVRNYLNTQNAEGDKGSGNVPAILLSGPSGSGKSYAVKEFADLHHVPLCQYELPNARFTRNCSQSEYNGWWHKIQNLSKLVSKHKGILLVKNADIVIETQISRREDFASPVFFTTSSSHNRYWERLVCTTVGFPPLGESGLQRMLTGLLGNTHLVKPLFHELHWQSPTTYQIRNTVDRAKARAGEDTLCLKHFTNQSTAEEDYIRSCFL